jgi:hypothetical protein
MLAERLQPRQFQQRPISARPADPDDCAGFAIIPSTSLVKGERRRGPYGLGSRRSRSAWISSPQAASNELSPDGRSLRKRMAVENCAGEA